MTSFPHTLAGLLSDERALRFLGESGYMALARGELDAAEAVFTGLVALLPDDPVGDLGLTEVHLGRMRPHDAVAAARRASEALNNSPETLALAYELSGTALFHLGDTEGAEAALRQAIEIAPDSHSAANAERIPEIVRRTRALLETNRKTER